MREKAWVVAPRFSWFESPSLSPLRMPSQLIKGGLKYVDGRPEDGSTIPSSTGCRGMCRARGDCTAEAFCRAAAGIPDVVICRHRRGVGVDATAAKTFGTRRGAVDLRNRPVV